MIVSLNRFHLHVLAAGVMLAPLAAADVSTYPFERYQVILDREPFGEATVAVAAPPPVAPVPQKDSFAKTIRMSALLEDDLGNMKVGLIDMTTNESFFLAVGDIEQGVELVSASYEDEEAVLRKGEEMAIIKLQSGEVTALSPEQQRERLTRQQNNNSQRLSYAERRRLRQERKRQPKPPPQPKGPRLTGEALQEHLESYQMEVIRQGLPPLPIPLTPEMDNQLVNEGVLPPVE